MELQSDIYLELNDMVDIIDTNVNIGLQICKLGTDFCQLMNINLISKSKPDQRAKHAQT